MDIYLDAAATTKPKQEVIEAMMPYLTDKWHNPSSLYQKAVNVKKDIEEARSIVGDFIGAKGSEIFFTSGGSESNCWVIQGFINNCNRKGIVPTIVTSTIEHKSIMACVDNMPVDVHYVGVDKDGFIDLQALNTILHRIPVNNKVLVSIQFANNEIGTIQNIKQIADLVHKYNAVFHTDAVQAFGQIHIDVNKMGIDMMSVSGHKLYTPKGVAFLYKKNDIEIDPIIYGSQMDSMRGGTENTAYIIGMAKAVELCQVKSKNTLIKNRDYMIAQLKEKFNCKVNGSLDSRLPNNINVAFPQNVTGESLIYMLDMAGIYVASGSACNSHSVEPSYVLKSIGLTDEEATKTIRITLSDDINKDMIDKVICEIDKSIRLLTV